MAQKTNSKISKEVQEKVLTFGRLLQKKGIPISKLVIFGSYAKNNASINSDIDVCIVSTEFGKDSIVELQNLLKERRKVDNMLEPFPVTPSDYNLIESPLMFEIRKHGLDIAKWL